MLCSNCGSIIQEGHQFCAACGSHVNLQPAQNNTAFCGNCGNQVDAGSQFCPGCGTQVIAQRQPVQPVQQFRQPVQQVQPLNRGYRQQMNTMGNRSPEEYLNLKGLRTWAAVIILLSPLFGIWSFLIINKIPLARSEMEARSQYKKAKNLCIIGSILGLLVIVVYSGM